MKKKIIVIVAGLIIITTGIALVLNWADPQAQAIREAKNYAPTGNEANCTQSETPALHIKSGAKYTFSDGCIPPGWSAAPNQ